MPFRRKNHKKHTTHNSNPHRQRRQHLLHPRRRRRPQALHHILIKHRHRSKHQHRHHRVREVNKLELIPRRHLRRQRRRSVDNPEPLESGEAVAEAPLLVLDAVREAQQEARERAEAEERNRHGPGGGVAVALVGEYRRQELEAEGRAGGQEVGEARGALKRLADGLLDEVSVYFRYAFA